MLVTSPTVISPGQILGDDPIMVMPINAPVNGTILTLTAAIQTVGEAIISGSGWSGAVVSIQPSGAVTVNPDADGGAVGFFAPRFDGVSLQNFGTIHVHGDGLVAGIHAWSDGRFFANYGQIIAEGRSPAGAIFESTTFFENHGLIRATATAPDAQAKGVVVLGEEARFTNDGTIIAENSSPEPHGANSVGVWIGSNAWNSPEFLFHNSGLIVGETALKAEPWSILGTPHREFFNDPGGVLRGLVDLGSGDDTLENQGLIEGGVNLGPGNDHYFGSDRGAGAGSGTVSGMVSGGLGDDELTGGPVHDYLQGNQGNDGLFGGGGDDWLLGGQGADLIRGEQGDDVIYGNLGDDTCDGGDGNDLLRGGQGADIVSGGAGDDFLSGDRGDDTISGGSGADVFHSWSDAGIDRVLDFHVSEGDRVMLDPGTAYTLRDTGEGAVIDMGGGNEVLLVGVPMSALVAGSVFFG